MPYHGAGVSASELPDRPMSPRLRPNHEENE